MALWICKGCTTAYAPDAPRCPHCGADEHVEQGSAEHLAMTAPAAVATPPAAPARKRKEKTDES